MKEVTAANSDKGRLGLPRDNMVVRRHSNTEHNPSTTDIKGAMAMMTMTEVLTRDTEDNIKTRTTAEGHLPKIRMDAAGAQCPVLAEGQFLVHKQLIRIVVNIALLLEEAQAQACQMDILRRMACAQGRMPLIRILQVSPLHITTYYSAYQRIESPPKPYEHSSDESSRRPIRATVSAARQTKARHGL
jgi:hypothetical protein